MYVKFELSVGDFIDRMTIAELKVINIGGEGLEKEFKRYTDPYHTLVRKNGNKEKDIKDTYDLLFTVNAKLWHIEDKIRDETEPVVVSDLSQEIISLNDARAYHKRQIDQLFGLHGDPKKYVGSNRNYTI